MQGFVLHIQLLCEMVFLYESIHHTGKLSESNVDAQALDSTLCTANASSNQQVKHKLASALTMILLICTIYVYMHVNVREKLYNYICMDIQVHICTYVICTYIYIHTYIYIYVYTYTYVCDCLLTVENYIISKYIYHSIPHMQLIYSQYAAKYFQI